MPTRISLGVKTQQWCQVIASIATAIVVVLAVVGCSTVTVKKVPTPSQYVVWTDRLQAQADDMEGLRFYLPRPFVNVFESFPIRTDIYLAEGVVSADGRFVIIRRMWDENGHPKYPAGLQKGLEIQTKNISTTLMIEAQAGTGDEEGKGSRDDHSVAGLPGIVPQPTTRSPQTSDASTGRNQRGVTNDNSAYAYQPMRGNMDILYLPDFDEQYVVSSRAGLGDAEFQLNLGQGWSLQGFNSLADNSRLNDRIFDIIDSASQLAKTAAFTAAGLPPVPTQLPGTTAIAPQSGTEDSIFVEGSPVSLKVVVVHYAAKGLYPMIKPRELQQRLINQDGGTYHLWFDIFNWIPLTTPSSTFDPGAIARAQQSIAGVTGKFTVPRYPYQFLSFNTFRYMAIEALTPGAHPFGTLYDKTGTQGDPGDRRIAAPPPATPGLPSGSISSQRSDDSNEKDLLALAEGLGDQDLEIRDVTYTVLRDPRPTYDGGKVKVHLSEEGTPSGTVGESEIQVGILKLMKEPEGLSAEDVVIVNKLQLKTIGASDDQDHADPPDDSNEKDLLALAEGLGDQDLQIKDVTYTVLRDPRPTYEEGKVKVYLSEEGTPSGTVGESEIQVGILKLMKEPEGLSAEDVVIVNKVQLKTISTSDVKDDVKEGGSEPQSGQLTAPKPSVATSSVGASDIKKIQAALCLRGSQLDGIWGPQTRQMLIKYQAEKGLKQDGVLTAPLQAELLRLPAAAIGARCASPPASGSSPPVPDAVKQ